MFSSHNFLGRVAAYRIDDSNHHILDAGALRRAVVEYRLGIVDGQVPCWPLSTRY